MLDVDKTLSNMDQRMKVLEGKKIDMRDWLFEVVLQVSLLRDICRQQQEEIRTLKSSI